MTDIKRMEKPTDFICEKCGKPMVIKWGKHGSFIACTGYPECTNTRELWSDARRKGGPHRAGRRGVLRELRPPMVLKKGRFGQFYACSGYPDCKTTKQHRRAAEEARRAAGEKCPQCGRTWC
jgi:DNA topoisomerase I